MDKNWTQPGLKTQANLRSVMREEARKASLSPDTHVNRLGDLLDIALDDLELLIKKDTPEAA